MLVSVKQLKRETNQESQPIDLLKNVSNIELTEDFKIENDAVLTSIFPRELIVPQEKDILSTITKDNILGKDVNLEKRKEMISAKAIEPVDFAYERAIGKNDSLYSNFIELIALTKRKVGRIVIIQNNKKVGYATGFMVSNTVMLTNHHVFKNKEMAEDSEVHFFYEYDAHGRPKQPVIFNFDTSKFYNNEGLDYCFVGLKPKDISGAFELSQIGYLYLDLESGKLGDVNVEKLNIIHHPLGDYKQLSIRENTFVDIDDTKIYYETDTAQGSSGSPVFNDQWQVVGLHHKSVAKMSPDGKNYLDIKGKVIPDIDGKIDITRVVWLKNEGIRISVILKHLKEKFPNSSIIDEISVPPKQENLSISTSIENLEKETIKNATAMSNSSDTNINISVPVNALSNNKTIDISLSTKNIAPTNNLKEVASTIAPIVPSELLFELSKIEKEKAVDFSECKGYDTDFLGKKVALPQPKDEIKNQIAQLKDGTIELKYFKHSVIYNALRKMPLISAVNVEGDASLRLDDSKRKDDWLRDTRIDIECQLYDKFYAKSKFDKGHMARFEDANWDSTEAKALRNSIYTCFYTNACPQVPTLNRTGFWGKLEKAVLEKGIKKEAGQLGRMTVFNGPIFNAETDKIFKGLRIPMEFFKIILWLDDSGKLKATAFKLSQIDLVGEVKFDESMRLDEEALDIDKVVAFKTYQCSIKSLINLTKIDFKEILKYDTFKSNDDDDDELFLGDEESIIL
jgi:endonuclease G